MIGFMLARSLAGQPQGVTQPLFPPRAQNVPCPPGVDPALRPDCAPRQTSSSGSSGGSWARYSTGSGGTVVRDRSATASSAGGNATVPRTALASPPARTNVVSRGGFGSTSRSFSSSSFGS